MRSPPSAAGIFSATFSMPATISDRVPVQARAIALMPEVTPLNNVRNGAMNSCTREAMSSSWVLKLLSQAEVLSIRVPKSTSARRLMKRSTHFRALDEGIRQPLGQRVEAPVLVHLRDGIAQFLQLVLDVVQRASVGNAG